MRKVAESSANVVRFVESCGFAESSAKSARFYDSNAI